MRYPKYINNQRSGYKQTPVGWIPDEWQVKLLSDCFKLSSGDTKPSEINSEKNDDYVYPVYGGNGIMAYANKSNLEGERIIIGRVGEYCGITRMITGQYWITDNALYSISVSDDIDLHFLSYKLQYEDLSKLRNKGGQPLISQKPIYLKKISLPTKKEQRRISTILSTWDKVIDATDKIIVNKEQLKKGLMQQLLTGKKRLRGFNGEWKKIRLKEAFDRVTRKNSEKNTNVVTVSAHRGFVKQTDFFNKVIASELLDNYFLLEKGEFVYNKSYSKGYDWGATKRLKEFEKAVVTTLYICFKLNDDTNYSPEFFEQFFEAGILERGLTKIAPEGGRAHGLLNVTPSDFFNLEVLVPEHKEQIAISGVLTAANKEIETLKSQLELYRQQKKGLMQVLLTGTVRVKA